MEKLSMKEEIVILNTTVALLERINLTGKEVIAYNKCVNYLNRVAQMLSEGLEDENGQN